MSIEYIFRQVWIPFFFPIDLSNRFQSFESLISYCPIFDSRGYPVVWLCSRNKLTQVGKSNCQFYTYPPLWSFWQFGLTSCVSLFPYVCHLKKTVTKFHLHILLQFRPFKIFFSRHFNEMQSFTFISYYKSELFKIFP